MNNKIYFQEITHQALSHNFEIESGTHGNKPHEETSRYQCISV